MEDSSGNDNTLSQNDGCEMFLRESKCEDDVENIQENPSLQTKINKFFKNNFKN